MDAKDLNMIAAGSNDMSPAQATRWQGRLLQFRPRSLKAKTDNEKFFANSQRFGGTERRVAQLISKHAPRGWRFKVGDRVAGCAGERIVNGTVLGCKFAPRRPAWFCRNTFAACWLQLDSGERAVANELRPV